jgi:hypothetical protein
MSERVKIWTNPGTEYAVTITRDAYGVYWVVDTHGLAVWDTDRDMAESVARGRALMFEATEVVPQVPQMASPLVASARCASGLGRGSSLTRPADAVLTALYVAERNGGVVERGGRMGEATISTLKAAARRGWLELDGVGTAPSPVTKGTITTAGRNALARTIGVKA